MARKRLSGPRADYLAEAQAAPEVKSSLKPLGHGGPPIAQVAAQSAAESALRDLADEVSAAKSEGRMIVRIRRDQIQPDHLARDRVVQDDEDMQALIESLRAHGQRTPIEVTELADQPKGGSVRYGLISGWRRLAALERLFAETGDPAYETVLALLRQPKDASDAYVSMVEENEIRVGLSYYERARVAAEATKRGVYESEKQALLTLFANVSRAKRSRIRSFVGLYHALDGVLTFPASIPERLGLALADMLKSDPDGATRVRAALRQAKPQSAADELAVLNAALRKPAAPKPNVPRAEHLVNGVKVSLVGQKITVTGKDVSQEQFDKIVKALG